MSREKVPISRPLSDRSILPMWDAAGKRFSTVWVDDRGTCSVEQHPIHEGGGASASPFHRYQNEVGYFYAIRCPASLSEAEQLRVIQDRPPGSAARALEVQAQERRSSRGSSSARSESEEAQRRGDW